MDLDPPAAAALTAAGCGKISLKRQGFPLPCLLDPDSKLFGAFGSPGLPSLVILAPDGTIFKYHQGLFPEMLKTLEREVREAAKVR